MNTVLVSSEPKQNEPNHKNVSKPQSVVVESSVLNRSSRILPPSLFVVCVIESVQNKQVHDCREKKSKQERGQKKTKKSVNYL